MELENIGSANRGDVYYRYKMPKMITKVEGRGNGIKTNIVNMVDIAKALDRPASYTTKYFGCELGAQSKFDEKSGTSLVNGAHETTKLAGLLENFIKKYVQCHGCGNPETVIIITKTEMITLKCAACGFVSDVDMRDKLTSFILKNPPEQKKGKDKKAMRKAEKERLKEGEAADEELKKLKKDAKKKTSASSKETSSKAATGKKKSNGSAKKGGGGSDEDHSNSPAGSQNGDPDVDDDDDDVQWQTDTSREAAQQRIQEQLNAVTAGMVMLSTTEPEQEKKPQKEKKQVLSNGNGAATVAKPAAVASAHDLLVSDIKGMLTKGSAPSQLQSYLSSAAGSPQEIMTALFESLFAGAGKGFAKDIGKKKNYLSAAVQEEGSQMLLLRAIESFCSRASADAVKEVALALKVLYDADLVEEEVIVQWYEEGSAGESKGSQMWKNVKPFIEWLQSAESESEEE